MNQIGHAWMNYKARKKKEEIWWKGHQKFSFHSTTKETRGDRGGSQTAKGVESSRFDVVVSTGYDRVGNDGLEMRGIFHRRWKRSSITSFHIGRSDEITGKKKKLKAAQRCITDYTKKSHSGGEIFPLFYSPFSFFFFVFLGNILTSSKVV